MNSNSALRAAETRDLPEQPAPSRGLPYLLAALAAMGPFAIDTYLPSFADIEASLGASRLEVQQTLTAYMAPFALMTLFFGALADAFGRRRVVLVASLLFVFASIGCTFAPSVGWLWFFRALQGACSGAGTVVGRAIIRDVLDGPQAQRLMSHVSMMFALAPAVAPVIGGWLQTLFGWRSVFGLLVLLSSALTLWCHHALPETLPRSKRQPLDLRPLAAAYAQVFSNRAFMAQALGVAFGFTAFFIYVMSAPRFLMDHLGLSETGFFWLFGPATAGMVLGSWYSGRTAGALSRRDIVRRGQLLMVLAVACNLLVSHALPPAVPWSVAPLFVFVLGMSMTTPALTLMGLDLFPERRGLAASCQSVTLTAANAINPALLAPLLWASPMRLAIGQSLLLAAAIAVVSLFFRWAKPAPAVAMVEGRTRAR